MHRVDLGRRSFGVVEALQASLRQRILDDAGEDTLLIVEHEPTVTLGRRGGALLVADEVLAHAGIVVHRVDRGGEATYHGPGQLVAYPVVRLRHGVVAHVEALARAVVDTAAAFGVTANFERDRPGVWVQQRKLASIGVHVHRRIATHGVALNVGMASLAGFSHIVPCGMPSVDMTCLEREAGPLDFAAVRATFTDALTRAFAD